MLPHTDHRGVKSFRGLVEYFCDFIPNYAVLSKLLTGLTCVKLKHKKLEWIPEHQEAFEALKCAAAEFATLVFPSDDHMLVSHSCLCRFLSKRCDMKMKYQIRCRHLQLIRFQTFRIVDPAPSICSKDEGGKHQVLFLCELQMEICTSILYEVRDHRYERCA